MPATFSSRAPSRRITPVGVLAGLAGVALFVYTFQRAGLGEIAILIGRLGWVFLGVLALGGLRFMVRGMAWRRCLEGSHQLNLRPAFQAVVAGDTLGNLTFLSILVSEPAKALYVADREPIERTLPALAVENLFYTLSAALVIAGGAVALMLRLGTIDTWWIASVGVIATIIGLVTLVHLVIWRRVRLASSSLSLLARRGPGVAARWAARVRDIEDRIYSRYPRHGGQLAALTAWELTFHGLAVLEIFLVLSLISPVAPTVLDAFVFEAVNRFIAVVFKVVPMRIGVDEAGTSAFAELLEFGTAAGVTLALVRKARMLVWMAIGGVLLARRGLSVGSAENRAVAGDGPSR